MRARADSADVAGKLESKGACPTDGVRPADPATLLEATAAPLVVRDGGVLSFVDVYGEWFDLVCRWLQALGGPEADLDDLAQEVFLVVRRKLDRFDGFNLRSWLYRITVLTLSDQRRRSWFRRRLLWRQDAVVEEVASSAPCPASELERKEAWRLLYRLLDKMSARRRETFILFELEGLSGEEIAQLQVIPVATVWTRLSKARREFADICKRYRSEEKTP